MVAPEMLARLDHLATEIGALHSKLILLVGGPHTGKTALLAAFAERMDAKTLNVGSELGRRLAAIPQKQRHLQVGTVLRELADEHAKGHLLLLDNIELLFDRTLRVDPLGLLKRQARATRIVAAWPGELRNGRLLYARLGHPEHQEYGLEGFVPIEIRQ